MKPVLQRPFQRLPGFIAGLLVCTNCMATELVYTPINPTFGGNPAYASGLQANASAQNQTKAPPVAQATPATALQRFTQQLESAVLSRLTLAAVNGLFDAEGKVLPNRTVTAGNYVIAITTDASGNLVLTTSDTNVPGSRTQIVVGNVTSDGLAQ